jgi:NitT/TauT family transport system permease protein
MSRRLVAYLIGFVFLIFAFWLVMSFVKNPEVQFLPYYTFRTLLRITITLGISVAWGVSFGILASTNRTASIILVPFIDLLQSIPILGYFPAVIMLFISIFQGSELAIEFSAMLLLFTSMAWAIFFGVVGAVKGIPVNVIESARSFGLKGFKYARHVVLPAIVPALVSGATLAWCDGWFFMIAAEYIEYSGTTYSVPGLGSFLAKASYVYDDFNLSIVLLLLITFLVVYINFLTWHRLMERATAGTYKPVLKLGLSGVGQLGAIKVIGPGRWLHLGDRVHWPKSLVVASHRLRKYTRLEKAIALLLMLALVFLVVYLIAPQMSLEGIRQGFLSYPADELGYLPGYIALTMGRLGVAYAISLGVALGMGILAAEHKKFASVFYPIYDIGQSVPILALFPVLFIALSRSLGGVLGLEVTSIIMLVLDMIWYMFLNIVSAIKNIPSEIKEVGKLFGFKGLRRIIHIVIPCILPAIVTGSILAWGTGWNTIIFSEYMPYGSSTIYLYPTTINQTFQTAQIFVVSLNVTDINGLRTWQTQVNFNASHLYCINVVEGEFFQNAEARFDIAAINNTSGTIGPINSTLIQSGQGISGSGRLASIYFTVLQLGESEITLSEQTKMLDSNGRIIPESKVYSLPGLGSYLDKTGYLYGNTILLILLLAIIATIVLLMEALIWRRLLRKVERYHAEV